MNPQEMTFDRILPTLREIFTDSGDALREIAPILINRDLNGRVRLIVDEKWESDSRLNDIARQIYEKLGPHAYPPEQAILFEPDIDRFRQRESTFPLEGCDDIYVVDRLATESDWTQIAPEADVPRIVFYSVKGGVGRSTALAAVAWELAEQNKRVLVMDLDLESPGLSSSLLPEDRRPAYGVTDWLVEDLVNNGKAIVDDMVAISNLSRIGDIRVVPAHGKNAGEYIAKLGRVWMPTFDERRKRQKWSKRLSYLVEQLEDKHKPDVVLLDSRAGIDETASAIVTDLGASLILLFAIDGDQTWNGYRILFQHWNQANVAREIRERLQVVAAMIPEVGGVEYAESLRENAYNLFLDNFYDPASETLGDEWNFNLTEKIAPHHPWPVRWHRGFAAIKSLYDTLNEIDSERVDSNFGGLIQGINEALSRFGK